MNHPEHVINTALGVALGGEWGEGGGEGKSQRNRRIERAGAPPHGAYHPRAQLIPPHLHPCIRSPASVGGASAAINLRRAVDMGMARVTSQTTAKPSN